MRKNNVYVEAFDDSVVSMFIPEWPALDKEEKFQILKTHPVPAFKTSKTHNLTTRGMHQLLPLYLSPVHDSDEVIESTVYGTAEDLELDTEDDQMQNPAGEISITEVNIDDIEERELEVVTYIDSTELNDNTLTEIGVKTGNSLLNHAPIEPEIEKSSAISIITYVYLQFGDYAGGDETELVENELQE